jgi:hypothetical protein
MNNLPHINTKSLPSSSIDGREPMFNAILVELKGFEPTTF